MKSGGYYGARTAQGRRADTAHAFLTPIAGRLPIGLTRIRLLDVGSESSRVPSEDAVVFTLSVGGAFEREMIVNGSAPQGSSVPGGSFSFLDMRDGARLRLKSPVDAVQFYVPFECLNAVATEEDGRPIEDLLGGGPFRPDARQPGRGHVAVISSAERSKSAVHRSHEPCRGRARRPALCRRGGRAPPIAARRTRTVAGTAYQGAPGCQSGRGPVARRSRAGVSAVHAPSDPCLQTKHRNASAQMAPDATYRTGQAFAR